MILPWWHCTHTNCCIDSWIWSIYIHFAFIKTSMNLEIDFFTSPFKTDTTQIWSWSPGVVSLALHKDWKQITKSAYQHLQSSLINTIHMSLFFTHTEYKVYKRQSGQSSYPDYITRSVELFLQRTIWDCCLNIGPIYTVWIYSLLFIVSLRLLIVRQFLI